jgi:hypothetical protein
MNGSLENFKESMSTLTIQPYEISSITYDNDEVKIPTQIESYKILSKFTWNDQPFRNWKGYSVDTQSILKDGYMNVFEREYNKWFGSIQNPLDGIVYCSPNWIYPTTEEEFNKKGYGKYAWKPNVYGRFIAKSLEYSMGKTSEFAIVVLGTMVEPIAGKNYTRVNISYTKFKELIQKEFGPNCVCKCTLINGIKLYINDVDTNCEGPKFELINKCPYCSTNLSIDTKHIKCPNKNCPERIVQLFDNFISIIHDNSKIKLKYLSSTGKPIKTRISIKTLRTIQPLTLKTLTTRIENIEECFKSLNLNTQLVALGNGSSTQCAKLIKTNNWKTIEDVPSDFKFIIELP